MIFAIGVQPASGAKPHGDSRRDFGGYEISPTAIGLGCLNASVVITLCVLLVLPGYALGQRTATTDWPIVAGVCFVMSVATFLVYRSDKHRAEIREWRISEITLHLLSFFGGWPGAFLAQQVFRHKTSKAVFQLIFWTIVFLHQFAALDSLMDWRLTKNILHTFA